MGWACTHRTDYEQGENPILEMLNRSNAGFIPHIMHSDSEKAQSKKHPIDPITQSMIRDTWSFDPQIRKGNVSPLLYLFLVRRQKTRGCFGTEHLVVDHENIDKRPKEKVKINGLKRRANYIYKVEEIQAAKTIAKHWKQHKKNRKKNK